MLVTQRSTISQRHWWVSTDPDSCLHAHCDIQSQWHQDTCQEFILYNHGWNAAAFD